MTESIKYKPLEDYLKFMITVTMSFSEIEEVLGFKLPPSAYKHKEWWDNNTHNHTQMWAWTNAGWVVEECELGKAVKFRKVK